MQLGINIRKYNAKDVGIRGISIQHWLSNSSSSSTPPPPFILMRRVNQSGDRSKPNKVQILRGLDGMLTREKSDAVLKKLTTRRKMQFEVCGLVRTKPTGGTPDDFHNF